MTKDRKNLEVALARRSFWAYCALLEPDFYKDNRPHLKTLCDTLQDFWEGKIKRADGSPYVKLMIQIPPRHGKSRTLVNFTTWLFGKRPETKVITASYNDDLAQDFSRYARDKIHEERNAFKYLVYSDVFDCKIKRGDSAYHQWSLEGQYFSYKGAGVGGSITGRGGDLLIIDDPIKGAAEAFNDNHLEKLWLWYTGTWISRKEEGAREIICNTAWCKKDISGRLLDMEPDEWYQLTMEACNGNGEMLCPELLSYPSYLDLKKRVGEVIFLANYHGKRIDIKGRLYGSLLTYIDFPRDEKGNLIEEERLSYTDTADEGDDYLCHIAGKVALGIVYVTDVIYTKAPQEETEPLVAESIIANETTRAEVESNNGGRAFARGVIRELKERNYRKGSVHWFYQGQNKRARLLTNSTNVMNNVRFPINWRDRWPEYYEAMNTYQREGKNAHDDAPDATTGIVEKALGYVIEAPEIGAGDFGL